MMPQPPLAGYPADIRRVLNVNGQITEGVRMGLLRGPVEQWVDELTDFAVGYGFDTFMFWATAKISFSGSPKKSLLPCAQVAAERG